MANVTGRLSLTSSFGQVATGVPTPANQPAPTLAASQSLSFNVSASGTLADQVDKKYTATLTLAATPTILNLFDALVGTQVRDVYGTAIVFARVDSITITPKTTTDGQTLVFRGNTLAAPGSAPSLTPSGSGGTLAAGTYLVAYSFVNANGETTRSADASATTTGSTSSIAVTLPALPTGATSINVYVSTAGGNTATETRQNLAPITTTTFTVTSITAGSAAPAANTATYLAWAAFLGQSGTVTIPAATATNNAFLAAVAPNTTGWPVTVNSKAFALDPGAATFDVDIEITGRSV